MNVLFLGFFFCALTCFQSLNPFNADDEVTYHNEPSLVLMTS